VALALAAGAAGAVRGALAQGAAPAGDAAARRRRAAAAADKGAFEVRPGRAADLLAAYADLEGRGRPLFVSTDLVMHGTRRVANAAAAAVEEEALLPALAELTDALVDVSVYDAKNIKGDRRRLAAAWNAGFFAVAHALFAGAPLDAERLAPLEGGKVLSAARSELAMILEHDGVHMSPLFGAAPLRSQSGPNGEDYTQYLPRGRYALTEALGRYFRGRLYLGRAAFALPEAGAQAGSLDVRATRQALLIASAVSNRPAVTPLWREVRRLDRFLYGEPDDPGPDEYISLSMAAEESLGRRAGALTETEAETARLSELAALVREDRRAHVVEGYVAGMRVLGQSAPWDAVATERLTRIPDRTLPKGLDVMALLGSTAARERLDAEGDLAADWYREALDSLVVAYSAPLVNRERRGFGGTRSLGELWLRAIARLFERPPTDGPDFLRDPGWRWKDLVTGSGAWAELRHTTILGVKQPVTGRLSVRVDRDSEVESKPPAYLEPRPYVYSDLRQIAGAMEAALRASARTPRRATDAVAALARTLESLRAIAETELRGEPIAENDRALLTGLASQFREAERRLLSPGADASGAAIADVFTDDSGGVGMGPARYLEVGTGLPIEIAVVVEPGAPAHEGAVFSYHEFASPERLTDAAWRERLASPDAPALPAWEAEWLARYR
jgi:hypothetical protein